MKRAFADYKAEVESGVFPADEHSYDITEEEWKNFLAWQ
jgi:ketopantoate hydroxymethyltransferase